MPARTHGHTRVRDGDRIGWSPEYRAWRAMKARCMDPKNNRFQSYAGRGITVCARWVDGDGLRSGFECFLADVGTRPSADHSIDRRDNDCGYEPRNVRWATRVEQARNRRTTWPVDLYGEVISLAEAIERFSVVPTKTARMRVHRGWSVYDAIFVPRKGRPGDADPVIPPQLGRA